MERKNSFISNFLIPAGYAILVYVIWEGIGFFASFVICCIASLSIGLMEEFVWRGIILKGFLSAWKDKKKGIYFAVLITSLCFGLCHYMNLLAGQDFLSTTKQVISAVCMGVFLSALYLQTNHLVFPILVHGLCDFSNFLMNEILGWDYSVWKYDDILQSVENDKNKVKNYLYF